MGEEFHVHVHLRVGLVWTRPLIKMQTSSENKSLGNNKKIALIKSIRDQSILKNTTEYCYAGPGQRIEFYNIL